MVVVSEPITHDITVYQGTDHQWLFRRKREDDSVIMPDSAEAQIRDKPDGKVWADLDISIDAEGWIRVSLPASATSDRLWYSRSKGAWDLKVTVGGLVYRWVMGIVTVSQEITNE